MPDPWFRSVNPRSAATPLCLTASDGGSTTRSSTMIKDSPNPPGQQDFDTSTLHDVAYRAINH
ncbi:hypothetical protein RBC47_11575, partial [Pseudomonas fluorescens]